MQNFGSQSRGDVNYQSSPQITTQEKMAGGGGEMSFARNSPAVESFSKRESFEEQDISDVEELKESLKNGLGDARRKITFLRKELKEK